MLLLSCLRNKESEQLSFYRAAVQKHSTKRWQDLRGVRDGEFPSGQHESHSVSLLHRNNQTQWGRAAAAAVLWRERRSDLRGEACWIQHLDVSVGHWEHGLDLLASLGDKHGRHQVATICWSGEDAWNTEREDLWTLTIIKDVTNLWDF